MRFFLCFMAVLTLAPLANAQLGDSKKPVDITADELVVDQREEVATFAGDVKVAQGDLQLLADKLTVIYNTAPDEEKSGEAVAQAVKEIRAFDNVTIAFDENTATGKQAVYRVAEGQISLEGDVVLIRGGNTLKGERLVFDMATNKVSLKSSKKNRVKASFFPGGSK